MLKSQTSLKIVHTNYYQRINLTVYGYGFCMVAGRVVFVQWAFVDPGVVPHAEPHSAGAHCVVSPDSRGLIWRNLI